jgi:hypothetical protein
MRINWCTVRLCDASRDNCGSRVINRTRRIVAQKPVVGLPV